MTFVSPVDPWNSSLVIGSDDQLIEWNRAGVLAPSDVHVANRLARLGGETDPMVTLAVALAVRAPRFGHVSVDLNSVRYVAGAELSDGVDAVLDSLPWPAPALWCERVAASPLVAVTPPRTSDDRGPHEDQDPTDDAAESARPLRLVETALYLDRYWREEQAVGTDLLQRCARTSPPSGSTLSAAITDTDQLRAVTASARRYLSVIVGGPGTGKTTTVGWLLALLFEQAATTGGRSPMVGLAAPTGKAAARLEQAVRSSAAAMASRGAISTSVASQLESLRGSTIHRLLGTRAGSGRFRHHRGMRLPHDVIVVDEASMISLTLMARLLEAVRPDARLVLVGDPEQLVSVEAGAVLADVVRLGRSGPTDVSPGRAPLARNVSILRTNHRSSGALASLAAAIRDGDDDAALSALSCGDPTLSWIDSSAMSVLSTTLTDAAFSILSPALDGDAPAALKALSAHRVLCAHRQGPEGASTWNEQIRRWLFASRPLAEDGEAWYVGRPAIVTVNDYSLGLYNGDTGVAVVSPEGGIAVAFDSGAYSTRLVRPYRLPSVETAYAMTVHKSQGSEFDAVTLILPPSSSRMLTRELLYTAVTRARSTLSVVGSVEAFRVGLRRRIARASGLASQFSGGNNVESRVPDRETAYDDTARSQG